MTVLVDIILPFFALMACGYVARAQGMFDEKGAGILNNFIYWFALPALLFRAMARLDASALLNGNFLLAYAGSAGLLALVGAILGRVIFHHQSTDAIMSGMNASYGNTGHLGIPLMFVAFGEAAAAPTIITTIVSVCISVVCMASIIASQQSQMSLARLAYTSLMVLLKNPLFLAPVFGLFWSAFEFALPSALENFTYQLGAAATPCALFAVGMFLYGKPIKGALPEVLLICVLKMIALPALVWLILNTVLYVPPLWEAVAVIMAATPVGVGSFVLAKRFEVYQERTSSGILISTIFSLFTLFVLLNYYLPRIS